MQFQLIENWKMKKHPKSTMEVFYKSSVICFKDRLNTPKYKLDLNQIRCLIDFNMNENEVCLNSEGPNNNKKIQKNVINWFAF